MHLQLLFLIRAVGAREAASCEGSSGHAAKPHTDPFKVDRPVKTRRDLFSLEAERTEN